MVGRQITWISSWKPQRRTTTSNGRTPRYSHWVRYNTFYGLVFTTTLATLLLMADLIEWRATGYLFVLANRFPGTVALIVQLLAAFFGLIHVAVVCRLINYALRLRLRKASVTLDVLRTWVDMSIPRIDWDLPLRFFFPVLLVVFLSLVPAALWAGSITPFIDRTTTTGMLLLPSYEDVSLIREYPMEIGTSGPSLRTQKGFFTYSVGVQHVGNLLSSAASASSSTTGKRLVHPKLDNTQFSYIGRSYGVGAPAGLTDMSISSNSQVAGYIYQEEGYLCNVTCIYNRTSAFRLRGPVAEWIYEASGNLPDSVDSGEMSAYIGHTGDAIVAIGVAHSERSPRRYLALAAGPSYAFLNSTQCALDFTPHLFNVTVDIANLNISVVPANPIPDFNPQRNLTRTVMRQFELLSNDLTNLYVSLLGDALNASIAAYNMSRPPNAGRDPVSVSEEAATLAGLTNSITAMADDMLAAYASAQLMVGKTFTQKRDVQVYLYGLQFGQRVYIYAIFVFNLLVLGAVAGEAVRTRGWRELGRFNYLDPRDLVIAASRGGEGVAWAADGLARRHSKKKKGAGEKRKSMKHVWLLSDPDEGNGSLSIRMKGDGEGHVGIVVRSPLFPPSPDPEKGERGGGGGGGFEDGGDAVDADKRAAQREWDRRRRQKQRVGLFGSM
ncbi:uncharacterized protein EI97DRAFT_375880 [Westerdykella ornata]|uniref:Uncharacterized protein n=1 Tax=Westerdykella ornata TaxID=318751 RepID=A0A6A6JN55_WESOR|nr:uncharacterized protein EI97DRAFT_375880 [Westerdykella ornata]KAF2277086.1 hypothetical protein EI97DRAFT_375880 [Westerdykella ornata]